MRISTILDWSPGPEGPQVHQSLRWFLGAARAAPPKRVDLEQTLIESLEILWKRATNQRYHSISAILRKTHKRGIHCTYPTCWWSKNSGRHWGTKEDSGLGGNRHGSCIKHISIKETNWRDEQVASQCENRPSLETCYINKACCF